jgi:hypothetical protein
MGRQRMQAAPAPLETDNQQAVLEHWRWVGRLNTLVAAIPNQRAHGQPGLTKGLADLLVLGPAVPGHPVGFVELKRDHRSVISDDQRLFARLCAELGIAHAYAVGRDEPIAVLEAWDVVRRSIV